MSSQAKYQKIGVRQRDSGGMRQKERGEGSGDSRRNMHLALRTTITRPIPRLHKSTGAGKYLRGSFFAIANLIGPHIDLLRPR